MTRKLKVYAWNGFRPDEVDGPTGQTNEVLAAHTVAEVLAITGMTRSAWNQSAGGETGNEHQIRAAMAEPGVVFWTRLDDGIRADAIWRRDEPKDS